MSARIHEFKATVAPGAKDKLNGVIGSWHMLVKVFGWKSLSDMCSAQGSPMKLQGLRGNMRRRRKQAKRQLHILMVRELMDAGFVIIKK